MSIAAAQLAEMKRRTWAIDRFPFAVPRYLPLGIFTGQRCLQAQAFYLSAKQRAAAMGGFEVAPRCYMPTNMPPGANGTLKLAAQDSQDVFWTPENDTTVTHMTASGIYAAETPLTYATMSIFTGLGPNGQWQHKWNREGINIGNWTGTGRRPFLLKPPIFLKGGEPILVRLTNALTVSLQIQVCFFGVVRVIR